MSERDSLGNPRWSETLGEPLEVAFERQFPTSAGTEPENPPTPEIPDNIDLGQE